MRLIFGVVVVLSVVPFNPVILRCQPRTDLPVVTCDQQTLARTGFGVRYKGVVRNDDYRFSATIPEGLVGWGAAPNAPFHGFAIFTGREMERASCIAFEIGIVVELGDGDAKPWEQRFQTERVKVGNRMAFQTSSIGSARGVSYENVYVRLELPREGYRNGVDIVLITPETEAASTKPVFARFLASFRFW